MRAISIREADRSIDVDIKMIAVRASRYRVIGSAERIPDSELSVIDLRDSAEPPDFAVKYQVLDRHPMAAILLVRRLED